MQREKEALTAASLRLWLGIPDAVWGGKLLLAFHLRPPLAHTLCWKEALWGPAVE